MISKLSPKLDHLIKLVDTRSAIDAKSTSLLRMSARMVISSAKTVLGSEKTEWVGSVVNFDLSKQLSAAQWNRNVVRDVQGPGVRQAHGLEFGSENEEEEEVVMFRVLMREGQVNSEAENLPEAEANYRSALEASGKTSFRNISTLEHNDANIQLASVLIKQKRLKDAKEFLSKLVDNDVLGLPDARVRSPRPKSVFLSAHNTLVLEFADSILLDRSTDTGDTHAGQSIFRAGGA